MDQIQGNRPLNVMILNAPTDLAGAEGVILNINRFMDPAKVRLFNCPFINFNRGQSIYLEELEARGILYDAIPLERRFEFRYINTVRALITKYDIDVIHSHGYRSDITALLATRGKIPVVSTLHGFTPKSWRVRLYEIVQQMMLKQMDMLIPVSDAIKAEVLSFGIPYEKISTLPNIVDIETLSQLNPSSVFQDIGLSRETLRMVYVGRLSIEKGLDVLLNACIILKKLNIPFHLILVGDGPLKEKYESLIHDQMLECQINFMGFRRDATRITAAADVLVLSSRTEGLPLVVLEAMAIGVPVVASRVGGLPELIQQYVNGILFDSGDAKGLADALAWLQQHRDRLTEMAIKGRQLINERYNPQQWIEGLTNIYRKTIFRRKAKKKISILTNHPGQTESQTWDAHSTRISIKNDNYIESLKVATIMFLKHWRYDCIVLGGGRSDMFYAILQTFLPFWKKPCIMIDCLWYESPSKWRSWLKIATMKLVDRSIDRYVVWASREIEAYASAFRLPREKFIFIPYHTTLDNYHLTASDGGYLFSGGNFARDYRTLIDSIRELPIELLIACTRPELFSDISIPDNVIIQGFTHEEYLKKMAGCTINIVALAPGLLHSGGQQTFLNSMYLGKPTIVLDTEGAKDYIIHGKDGLLVEAGNPDSLRKAILYLVHNKQEANILGKEAQLKVREYSTEAHFIKIINLAEALHNLP